MSMPLQKELRLTCSLCESDLRHCHGTALVSDGACICSDDPNCSLSADEHWFISLDEN
jgi:hypothetical protein